MGTDTPHTSQRRCEGLQPAVSRDDLGGSGSSERRERSLNSSGNAVVCCEVRNWFTPCSSLRGSTNSRQSTGSVRRVANTRSRRASGATHEVVSVLCAAFLLLTACSGHLLRTRAQAPSYSMKVDTIAADGETKPRSYFLIPGLQGVSTRDLQYREFAAQAARALKYRGYTKARTAEEADAIILLSYGIGEPRVEYELISSPVYGLVPSGTSTTTAYGTTTSFGGVATTAATATTTQGRTLGVVGTATRSRKTVEYDRYLRLTAVSTARYKQTAEVEEVWQTTVTSSGWNDDLRRVFPVMLAGAMRRIGVDTGGKQPVEVPEDHPRVLCVKGNVSAAALASSGQ
jgi:hypothetical protein